MTLKFSFYRALAKVMVGKMDGTFLLILLDRLFKDGGPLPGPFGDCGGDPTSDGLGCQGSCP